MALYLFVTLVTFHQFEEDAFIYFRFAENIANGDGYVFNPGGERIESGSSLLWQMLLVAITFLPGSMFIKTKILSIVVGISIIIMTYLLSKALVTDETLQLAAPLLLVVSTSFYCWSQRGLETPFWVLTLLLLCWCCCVPRLHQWWPFFAFLVFCARPEGFVILLALIPFFIIEWRTLQHVVRGAALLVGACAVVTLGRLVYFGAPFPHPFYLKVPGSATAGADRVLEYAANNYLLLLVIPFVIIVIFCRRYWSHPAVKATAFLAITLVWAFTVIDKRPYVRHLMPALPFFFVLVARAADVVSAKGWGQRAARAWLVGFAVLMLFISETTFMDYHRLNPFSAGLKYFSGHPGVFITSRAKLFFDVDNYFPTRDEATTVFDHTNTNTQAVTGKFIRANYPEGISIVHDQMGQTPWFAGLDKRFRDSFGLVSKTTGYYVFGKSVPGSPMRRAYKRAMGFLSTFGLGELPSVSREEALQFLLEDRPELIMVHMLLTENAPRSFQSILERDERVAEHYRPAYVLNGVVRIYQRKDLQVAEPIVLPPGVAARPFPLEERREVLLKDTFESGDLHHWRTTSAAQGGQSRK